MDEEYIFTRSEFAKMLDLTPNCVRMRMRRGHFAEESKYIKNKWMFKRPRPNQVVRPSRLSPVSLYRRRGITKHGTTNYDNIRNATIIDSGIGESHTKVPGPDNRHGFGGTCLPKDTHAFKCFFEQNEITPHILSAVIHRNDNIDRPEKDWQNDRRAKLN